MALPILGQVLMHPILHRLPRRARAPPGQAPLPVLHHLAVRAVPRRLDLQRAKTPTPLNRRMPATQPKPPWARAAPAAAMLSGLNRAPDGPPCFTRRGRGEALSPRRQEAGAVLAAQALPPTWIPLGVKRHLPPAAVQAERPLRQELLPSGRLCAAPTIQPSPGGPKLRQLAAPVSPRSPPEGARRFRPSTPHIWRHIRQTESARRFSGIKHPRFQHLPVSAAEKASPLHLPRQECGHRLGILPYRQIQLYRKRPLVNGGRGGAVPRVQGAHCSEPLAGRTGTVRLHPAWQEP